MKIYTKNNTEFHYPIIFLVAVLLGTLPLFCQAEENVSYFYNDTLQKIILSDFILTLSDKNYPLTLKQYATADTFLLEKTGYQSEIENPLYCPSKIGVLAICDLTASLSNRISYQKAGKLILNENEIRRFLERIAQENATQISEPARFEFDIETKKLSLLKAEKSKLVLDIEKSLAVIKKTILKNQENLSIALIASEIKPAVTAQDIDRFSIKDLIAKGQSNFAGSPANRIHNINVATEQFRGIIIHPQEEFSFTSILGPVEESTGYKEELVIKKNETIPEFGGGVCQVSTTMFRAALNAGLEITERHNHAYPVSYYSPQGTDATIYLPRPDLRFKNNTSGPILIQPNIKGNVLTIAFYGTSDNRQVEIQGPEVTEKTQDGKLRTILFQRLKDKDGNLVFEKAFKSFYDNPANYKHPEPIFTEKPKDWSKEQWSQYQKDHPKDS